MSLGCPVITAEVPGTREQCGDAALYFLPTSDQQLADRIKEVLENSTVRNRLIDHGRARAASWRVEDYAHEMIVLFDEFALIARAWEKSDSAFT
jgi:glycosyltransferase involved in cell wall biosynthesis